MANPAVTHRRTLYLVTFEKIEAAIQARDVEAFASFYHPKFEMKMYSSVTVVTK